MDFVVALLTLAFMAIAISWAIGWIYGIVLDKKEDRQSARYAALASSSQPKKEIPPSAPSTPPPPQPSAQPKVLADIFERDDTYSAFFRSLLEEISFIEDCTIHQQIDYVLYALFKARVIFSCALMLEERPQDQCGVIMQEYDAFQYIAFFSWMSDHAPAFAEQSDIADSRFLAYEKVLTECNAPSLSFAMMYIGDALHWFFENGWKKNDAGELSCVPTDNFNLLQMLKECLTDSFKQLRKEHQQIYDMLDLTLVSFCDERVAELVAHI